MDDSTSLKNTYFEKFQGHVMLLLFFSLTQFSKKNHRTLPSKYLHNLVISLTKWKQKLIESQFATFFMSEKEGNESFCKVMIG